MSHTLTDSLANNYAFLGQPNCAERIARTEELRAAYQRIKMLEADLLECREFLEGQVDVVDGDYGEPSPNRAMQLVTMIDESLYGQGGF